MSSSLVVVLEDAVAGHITRLHGGRLRFDYEPSYVERRTPTPLSTAMSLQTPTHADRIITPWLWGLLPDNDSVLRRWAREFHVSPSSALSLLGTPVGADCAGAVRFADRSEEDSILRPSGDVTWITESDVAAILMDLRSDSTTWLGRSFTGQFSLAGAQAKTALLFEDGRWGVPTGATPTTHILKPAAAGLADQDLNEHLCLDAARRVGLIAAETRIAQFADQTAVVVTRYDRHRNEAGLVQRVHQEDLCQALGVSPSQKYQNEGGPTPRQIGALFRALMAPRIAAQAVRRFADALIWNWLIGGTDAHAKNYSLLLSSDQVRLAPLYDIASALPYGANEHRLRYAMKLGGRYGVDPRRDPWPEVAGELGLEADSLRARVRELALITPDAFAEAARAPAVASLDRDLPRRLVDLVADRAGRCLAVVGV